MINSDTSDYKENRKKRVLFLITTLSGGGAEKILTDYVNTMNPSKYDVTVQTFHDIGIYRERLADHVHYRTIVRNPESLAGKVKSRLLWMLLPPAYVYHKYVEDGYDYEVAFTEGVATKFIAASDSVKARKYAYVHIDLYSNFYTERFWRNQEEQAKDYKKFDRILCVSESTKIAFEKRFGHYDAVQVKYNYINDEEIIRMSGEELKDAEKSCSMRIITIGRLVSQKGYDRLLRIMKNLKNDNIDIELWILGEGEKHSEFSRFINREGLQREVKLWGFQDNPYKFMKYCDLFVCSSRSEGYGLAIAEAMLLGLPILSTICSGPDELLGNGKYGMLVENSEAAIEKGIRELYDSKNKLEYFAGQSKKRVGFFLKKNRIDEMNHLFE